MRCDDLAQVARQHVDAGVIAAAVGAFGDEQVGGRHRRRDRAGSAALAAEIAGEGDAALPSRRELRCTIAEPSRWPASTKRTQMPSPRSVRRLVGHAAGQLHACGARRGVVERRDRRLAGPALAIEVVGVFFLNLGGVGEHDGDQIARGRRAVDRPAKALPDQVAAGCRSDRCGHG